MLKISHTIMYTKGWYKRSDNIWEDIKQTLKCDNYTPGTNRDVLSILTSQFDKLPHKQFSHSIASIIEGISPFNCWKHGYYTREFKWLANWAEKPEWNLDEAVLRYILSVFALLDRDEFLLVEPDYKKCLPNPKTEEGYTVSMDDFLKYRQEDE